MARVASEFKAFDLFQLLRGSTVYPFAAFYEAKNTLMRYPGSTDYINYGYWPDGVKTVDPSRALVELVTSRLEAGADDVVLNIGSGLGQPDVDTVQIYGVRKVIGVNVCAEQIAHAEAKFEALGLAGRIQHRLLDACAIDTLAGEGITRVMCIEAIQEISAIEECMAKAALLLPAGGRLSCCGEVEVAVGQRPFHRRALGALLMKITSTIYGEHYQPAARYLSALERAGLKDIRCESIGENVYPHAHEQLKKRLPALRQRQDVPLTVKILAYLNMRVIEVLFRWKCIDYVLISARK